jgi:hypothetical protein
MKTTTNPLEIAELAWDDTHEANFERMAERIMEILARADPPPADSGEFLARVMELAWKTGFACGLEFVAMGAVTSFPTTIGKN